LWCNFIAANSQASGDSEVEFLKGEEEVRGRAAGIKLLILDVDGVLTDGGLIWHANGQESKVFHVHDGHGIRLLQRAGIEAVLLTGRRSQVVDHRAHDLGIKLVVQGSKNKLADYEEILQLRKLDDQSVAYVGDDLVDVPVFKRVGLAVAVANATSHILPYCHASTESKGGRGAVREICEFLLQVQGKWEEVTAVYFNSEIA
jgi:3-deoxy-D-manno-octulosonate 8-phosphate phosphatase (KDO 8-P phosphatase)